MRMTKEHTQAELRLVPHTGIVSGLVTIDTTNFIPFAEEQLVG
jgi:hypothetical protein